MAPRSAATGGLLKFLWPGVCLQFADVTAAAGWGIAATTAAPWLVQAGITRQMEAFRAGFNQTVSSESLLKPILSAAEITDQDIAWENC